MRAPRDVAADYARWPSLFPTISGVRLVRREGERLVLQVSHNRFTGEPGGTRFTDYGEIRLKGWARVLRPVLPFYVRRLMHRLQLDPVRREAERREAERREPRPEPPRPEGPSER